MRLFITGLAITAISLTTLFVLQRRKDSPPDGPERTTKTMLWKASTGQATVWLAGSIHVLRESDYPLPEPWRRAWDDSTLVVMETKPGSSENPDVQKEAIALSSLPAGQSIDPLLSPETRNALAAWCTESGVAIDSFRQSKPWMASLRIGMTTLDRLGFSAARGIERHLGARLGSRRTEGLETTAESLGILDSLSPSEQDQLVATAIRDARHAPTRIAQLAQAWHEGDATTLDSLLRDGFKDFPQLRRRLIDDRNAAWLPKIRSLLKGSENAIVIVGSGHLAGPDSLVDLLAKEGVSLTQQEHTTRRPAPATH